MCGCTNIKFQVKSMGSRGHASYYRTGVKRSWLIPSGYKTYNGNKRQETVCLCTKCGYSWTWIHPIIYAFWINVFPKIFFVVLYLGNIAAIGSVNPIFSIIVFIAMTAILIRWLYKKYKQLIESNKEKLEQEQFEKDIQKTDSNLQEIDGRLEPYEKGETKCISQSHTTVEQVVNITDKAKVNYTIITEYIPDELIFDAGRYVIEAQRASIGMLQRTFKIGFNRSARIMDQLAEAGVVSEEQGTLPRKILMALEEFEKYVQAQKEYNASIPLKQTEEVQENARPMVDIGDLTIPDFDKLTGDEFEIFCSWLLAGNGFTNIEKTPASGNRGIDIVACKDGIRYAIQCKCYSSNVGNKAVQEVFAGKQIYGADVAVIITNTYFTRQATVDAEDLRVRLWDRSKLVQMIAETHKNE